MSETYDDFNMTMRKFLKQVGVSAQQAIERAMRDAGAGETAGRSFAARAVVTIDELGLTHTVEGRIAGRGAGGGAGRDE